MKSQCIIDGGKHSKNKVFNNTK